MPIETKIRGAFIHLNADLALENFQILRETVFSDDEGNELNREPNNEQTADDLDPVELLKKVMPDLAEIARLRKCETELAELKAELIAVYESEAEAELDEED